MFQFDYQQGANDIAKKDTVKKDRHACMNSEKGHSEKGQACIGEGSRGQARIDRGHQEQATKDRRGWTED